MGSLTYRDHEVRLARTPGSAIVIAATHGKREGPTRRIDLRPRRRRKANRAQDGPPLPDLDRAREDLVAASMIGLCEAADRYDNTRDESFLTFAEHRIRGAVLDELRRGDMVPRRVRQLARKIAAAIRRLEQTAGAAPSDHEVASELGVTVETYRADLSGLVHVEVAPLGDQERLASESIAPDVLADRRHTLDQVRAALETLCERDVRILAMHYLEELTFQQIAVALGITPSRVCQLLWRAVERLRGALGMRTMRDAA